MTAKRTRTDQHMAEQHLACAERNVARGRSSIERQSRLVAELERDGHDATKAKSLLAAFRDVQAQHEAHRDRLLAEVRRSAQCTALLKSQL
jgi:regulator of protease activity HflC (stomatin/prohibitin superfamily)